MSVVDSLQGAQHIQHFADRLHGLGQVLHGVVLHIYILQLSGENLICKFILNSCAGLLASPQREGIIARDFGGNKCLN